MNQAELMKIIVGPCFSEKATMTADKSKHMVFKVLRYASKPDIHKAVELMFDVKVDSVRTLNVKSKACRFGRTEGKTKAWKKAYVKLKPGNDIRFEAGMTIVNKA